ncbi:MAG: lipopolysaccharide transport periplasmic protein LptA [Gammaproteobacteria bacterium]|nr:lipopolysaccharide transport periplasmic protein LptA [Gammaproteobacteria bacterium]
MKPLTNFMFLFALLFNVNAVAKSTDKEAPLHIEADQLEIREKDSVSIYNGHVKITKGTMKISGDKIIIKNKDGRLHTIHINGKPATFYQLNDLDEVVSAESYIMDYKSKTGLLELKEKALLLKNKNQFSSEHIIYNTLDDIVKAGNHKTPDSQETPRVKITIHPEPQSSDTAK